MSAQLESLIPIEKLNKDIRMAIRSEVLKLTKGDIRYLVDTYYQIQEFRKASMNQKRSGEEEEPSEFVTYVTKQFKTVEDQIKVALNDWTSTKTTPGWVKSLFGFGPVLAAGLEAHIDIAKTKAVSSIWRYGGFDPTCKWEKNQKRPWNARLKVLFWKIGDCIVKFKGSEKSFYGPLYEKRKVIEIQRNEEGLNAEVAAETLKIRKIKDPKTKKIYESGKFPDGRIDLRARRWAVKIFLCHYYQVAFREMYPRRKLPMPWVIGHDGHEHFIEGPNMDDKGRPT